ncbi:MAG: hypothetical protein IPJ88_18605 [Myxococcales bacterium]|nr:MAG: hypothetical protein IPJ88_18605 [Myxococcales bacterium]
MLDNLSAFSFSTLVLLGGCGTSGQSTTSDAGTSDDISSQNTSDGSSSSDGNFDALSDCATVDTTAPAPTEVSCPSGSDPGEVKYYVSGSLPPTIRDGSMARYCFTSPSMNRPVAFVAYTPPDYESSNQDYPVIYFLHGISGQEWNYLGWFSDNSSNELLTKENLYSLIEGTASVSALADKAIVVFANGGRKDATASAEALFYSDQGDYKSETMIMTELIPFVDSKFRTVASRAGRAIEGFSMGGHGSLRLAMTYPACFASAVSYAAGLGANAAPDDIAEFRPTVDQVQAIKDFGLGIRVVYGTADNPWYGNWLAPGGLKEFLTNNGISFQEQTIDGLSHQLDGYYDAQGRAGLEFHFSHLGN